MEFCTFDSNKCFLLLKYISFNVIKGIFVWKDHQKFKCLSHGKCEAYTFEKSRLNCKLYPSSNKELRYSRGKEAGLKRTDYLLSPLEISYCSNMNRKRRCRSEPKCNHVNCLRKAHEWSYLLKKVRMHNPQRILFREALLLSKMSTKCRFFKNLPRIVQILPIRRDRPVRVYLGGPSSAW